MESNKPIAIGDMVYVIDDDKTRYHGFVTDIRQDISNPFEGEKEIEYVIRIFQFSQIQHVIVSEKEYKTLWWRI